MKNKQESEQQEEYRRQQREADAEALGEFRRSKRLTSRVMLVGILAREHYRDAEGRSSIPVASRADAEEIGAIVDRLEALTKVFEGAVWYLGGLQEKVNACASRGMKGQADGWSVLLYCLAGRCMLTFKDEQTEQTLTLITADDETPFERLKWGGSGMGPMGIQSIDCTEEIGYSLLKQAIKCFPEVHADDEVCIA